MCTSQAGPCWCVDVRSFAGRAEKRATVELHWTARTQPIGHAECADRRRINQVNCDNHANAVCAGGGVLWLLYGRCYAQIVSLKRVFCALSWWEWRRCVGVSVPLESCAHRRHVLCLSLVCQRMDVHAVVRSALPYAPCMMGYIGVLTLSESCVCTTGRSRANLFAQPEHHQEGMPSAGTALESIR